MPLDNAALKPFADESTCLQINGMTIENRIDRVSLFGSIDLTRDKVGFAMARLLKSSMDAVVAQLEEEENANLLPESVKTETAMQIDNPLKAG